MDGTLRDSQENASGRVDEAAEEDELEERKDSELNNASGAAAGSEKPPEAIMSN